MIKSRNRVKTAPKNHPNGDGHLQANGYPAAHPDLANAALSVQHSANPQHQQLHGGDGPHATPGAQNNLNIAPQHIFDTVSFSGDAFASPSLPNINNGVHIDPSQTDEHLQQQNMHLKTRVNELEVINDLFRGRVSELEQAERGARQAEAIKAEEAERQEADLAAANVRVSELEKRLAELESPHSAPSRKRSRRGTAEALTEDDVN